MEESKEELPTQDETDSLLGGLQVCASYLGGRKTPTRRAPLSERGEHIRDSPSEMAAHLKMAQAKGAYHPETNAQGVVDFGSSLNGVCQDFIVEKMNSPEMKGLMTTAPWSIPYTGSVSLRGALADFLAKNFDSTSPINPRSLTVTNSAEAGLDLLLTMLCDPGENACTFSIDIGKIENIISNSWMKGITMKVAILDNPKNPTGDVLSEPELDALIQVFRKHNMHLIVDEVNALSTLPSQPFTSVLSMPNIPDSYMVHFVWGFPEDFAMAGVGCGVVHTLIPTFSEMCFEYMSGMAVPAPIQEKLALMLRDEEWLSEYFIRSIRHQSKSYRYFKSELERLGVEIELTSGHFIWADFSKFMPSLTKDAELALFEDFLTAGVFVRPGTSLLCNEPGWFRITFTNPYDISKIGLQRLVCVLDQWGKVLKI